MVKEDSELKKRRVSCSCFKCPGNGIREIRFPHISKYPERYYQWLKLIGRPDLLEEDPKKIYSNKRLCSLHFSEACWLPNYKKLRPDSLPDLHLPDPSEFHIPETFTPFTPGPDSEKAHERKKSPTFTPKQPNKSIENPDIRDEIDFDKISYCEEVSPSQLLVSDIEDDDTFSVSEYASHFDEPEACLNEPGSLPPECDSPQPECDLPPPEEPEADDDTPPVYETIPLIDPLSPSNLDKPFDVQLLLDRDYGVTKMDPHQPESSEQIRPGESTESPESQKENEISNTPKRNRPSKLQKTYNVKVLDNENTFNDPSVISSVLGKVELKKKGDVFIVPMKGVNIQKLTKRNLMQVIRHSAVGKEKKTLLNVIQKIPSVKSIPIPNKQTKKVKSRVQCQDENNFKYIVETNVSRKNKSPARKRLRVETATFNSMPNTATTAPKLPSERKCSCLVHKCFKTYVTSGVNVRIDGNSSKFNHETMDISETKNLFTVSTILTNIKDKSQVEQLCQLLLESLYKLKNMNTPKTMGTVTIYLAQDLDHSNSKESESVRETALFPTATGENSLVPQEVSEDIQEETDAAISNLESHFQHSENPGVIKPPSFASNNIATDQVAINLQAKTDHNYSTVKSKVFFHKPDYLVHLVKLDSYTHNKKKTRILQRPRKLSENKLNNRIRVLNSKASALEKRVKKRDEIIQKLEKKLKNFRGLFREEKAKNRTLAAENSVKNNKDKEFPLLKTSDNGEPVLVKKKRKRRTKSEIEADRLLKESCPKIKPPRKKKKEKMPAVESASLNYPDDHSYKPRPRGKVRKKDIDQNFDISAYINIEETNEVSAATNSINNLVQEEDEQFLLYKRYYESLIFENSENQLGEIENQ